MDCVVDNVSLNYNSRFYNLCLYSSKRLRHKKGSKATIGIIRGYSIDTQDNNEDDFDESYRPPCVSKQPINAVTTTDITDVFNHDDEEEDEEQVIENHRVEVITRQEQTEDIYRHAQ